MTDTLAAVLRAEPAWTELPAETPAGLQRLLRRCLQKDARRRWQHIGDVRLELGEADQVEQDRSGVKAAPRPRMTTAALVTVAVGFGVLGSVLGVTLGRWSLPRDGPSSATPVSFRMAYGPGERLANTVRSFGISRDGRHIAYAAVKDGRQQLFLRALDRSDAVAIAGTDNATYPVFSPDGGSLAFWADGWIKRVPVAGGVATNIAAAQAPRGLAWAPTDRIVFAASALSGLSMVSASGGAPESLTELDVAKREANHRWPIALPDGSGVLLAVQKGSRTEQDIEGVSFLTKARTSVRTGAFPVQVTETGHLVYAALNGDTFAAPFDVQRMALTGPSMPMPERPGYAGVPGNTSPALSPAGTMVSIPLQEPARRLVVVGRNGTRRVLDLPAQLPAGPRLAGRPADRGRHPHGHLGVGHLDDGDFCCRPAHARHRQPFQHLARVGVGGHAGVLCLRKRHLEVAFAQRRSQPASSNTAVRPVAGADRVGAAIRWIAGLHCQRPSAESLRRKG